MVKKAEDKPVSHRSPAGADISEVYDLYNKWIEASMSNAFMGIISSLALADLLHSAGLMKDSMYGRITTFLTADEFVAAIRGLASAGASLTTLVQAERKAGKEKKEEEEEEGYLEKDVKALQSLLPLLARIGAA